MSLERIIIPLEQFVALPRSIQMCIKSYWRNYNLSNNDDGEGTRIYCCNALNENTCPFSIDIGKARPLCRRYKTAYEVRDGNR
jgi:hypothetical protein